MAALYIRMVNKVPTDHPISVENFLQAFPGVDPDKSPDFLPFVRVRQDVTPSTYEVAYCTYKNIMGKIYDVWKLRPMTADEIAATNADIDKQREEHKARHIAQTDKHIAELPADDEVSRAVLQAYKDNVASHVVADRHHPNFPLPPVRTDKGWASAQSPGRPPNAIG